MTGKQDSEYTGYAHMILSTVLGIIADKPLISAKNVAFFFR